MKPDTVLTFAQGGQPNLTAHRLSSGIVVTGSAAHAPMLNGTFFSVAAVFPKSLLEEKK